MRWSNGLYLQWQLRRLLIAALSFQRNNGAQGQMNGGLDILQWFAFGLSLVEVAYIAICFAFDREINGLIIAALSFSVILLVAYHTGNQKSRKKFPCKVEKRLTSTVHGGNIQSQTTSQGGREVMKFESNLP